MKSYETVLLQLAISLMLLSSTQSAFCPSKSAQLMLSRPFIRTACLALPSSAVADLEHQGYCVIPNFIPNDLQAALRADVASLRGNSNFKVAKIGQDSTNTLNQEIRVAETCFLGTSKTNLPYCDARNDLYQLLAEIRMDLAKEFGTNLDANLDELLYAYYPKGGFYRRHRDAIPGSASVLRSYSLLLYLNEGVWEERQGGQLRLHLDAGRDVLPQGETPNFVDILPQGGTLVLLKSDSIPHEVLDTNSERIALVGWYNRAVSAWDISNLAGEGEKSQLLLLAVAVALVTVGLVNILG